MELGLLQAVILTGVGIVAGFLNVMAGGGSLLSVPVLVFMGLPGPVANGTNRIAILAQNLSAINAFFRRGFSDFKRSLSLAACARPGAAAGALLGVNLEGVWFNRILALVMIGVMLVMQFDKGARERPADFQPSRQQLVRGHLLMVAAGFWGGFIQIGVGFILMPILNRAMGLDLVRTKMITDIQVQDGTVRVAVDLPRDHQFAPSIGEDIKDKIEPRWDVDEVIVEFTE